MDECNWKYVLRRELCTCGKANLENRVARLNAPTKGRVAAVCHTAQSVVESVVLVCQ